MEQGLIEIKVEENFMQVFSAPEGLDPYIQQAREIVDGFEHDLTTLAGRQRTASLANKVAKLKTKLDGLGKDLVSDWKTKAKAVDNNRKEMRQALDELKTEARLPLTEWEQEQESIALALAEKEAAEALAKEVESDHEIAILIDRELTRQKAEDAALEKLLAEKEAARIAAEKEAEQAAIEKNARIQAERDAEETRQRLEREAEESNRKRIAAEEKAASDAENARLDQIRIHEEAEQQKVRDKEKREANTRHVGKVRKEAKEAFMSKGLDEAKARELVIAINNGLIPNVSISY